MRALEGIKVGITGVLKTMTRPELTLRLYEAGGLRVQTVQDMDYLVVGEPSSRHAVASRLRRARMHNVTLITEDEILELIGGAS